MTVQKKKKLKMLEDIIDRHGSGSAETFLDLDIGSKWSPADLRETL